MKLLASLLLLAFVDNATVKIINQSSWEIHHVFLSASDEQSWGEDQLEDEILAKGESLTLTGIACDLYDVKIVDEDGDECIVEEVDLCGGKSYWKVTDKDLQDCR